MPMAEREPESQPQRARSTLSRRMAVRLVPAFVLGAGLLLAVSVWIGRQAMRLEHEAASMRMASLFETSLRNAMLQRDLEGLERLVARLGSLPGMASAEITTARGEVRFASKPGRRGADVQPLLAGLCLAAGCGGLSEPRAAMVESTDGERLQVIYPVRNEPICAGCHGLPAEHPVNGVLLLEFSSAAAEAAARTQAGTWLLPSALLVLAGLGVWVAMVLQRLVLRPVKTLHGSMQALAAGQWAARSGAVGSDELAALGRGFDRMAERLQAQVQSLAAHGAFLQNVLDAAPDAMVLIGRDHRIVMANAAYARLLGRPIEHILGSACHRVSRGLHEPCASTLVDCPLIECERAGRPVRTVMAFEHADGSRVDVEIDAAAVDGLDGQPQVIEVIRPLQEQVRFSQEQRLSAIGLLANGVAHEIHNPLASIRLALQSSLRGLRDGTLERDELEDYLRLVDEQIDRCVHITQRLLRLSQPPGESAQPVWVAPAVDDVSSLLADEARRAGVAVRLNQPDASIRISGDEGELRQVLVNLLQNAIHAMPQGGQLDVEVVRERGSIRISVSDTGVGIAPDLMPLIFLPFYSRRADGRRGTGLGLSIAKSMVELRGGRISATSEPGKGSRFDVVWPDVDASLGDAA